jgi:inactivated superfamily I helicase
MNLYRTLPNQLFLQVLADFIIDNFANNFGLVKVILPSGVACVNLQRILVTRLSTTILPNIMRFSDISIESPAIFDVPLNEMNSVTILEEKVFLAEIIHNYDKLQFTIIQALKFSQALARLFYEFTCNDIQIETIKNLPIINLAQHWQSIYEFLHYAFHEWQLKMNAIKKLDRASYQANTLKTEIRRIENNESVLIIAGIVGQNKVSWDFLRDVSSCKSGFIILPPMADLVHYETNEAIEANNDIFYCLKQLLKTMNRDLADFSLLGNMNDYKQSLYDYLIVNDDFKLKEVELDKEYNIKYIEFDDIFQEADYIATICTNNQNKKIAIIINDDSTKKSYINFLLKYSLQFHNLLGEDLSQLITTHLIIAISEILCNEFNLMKLFVLLKNPLMVNDQVLKLERILSGNNRFAESWNQILSIIEPKNDRELTDYCTNLSNILTRVTSNETFDLILRHIVKVTEQLYHNIWQTNEGEHIADFCSAILELNWHFTLLDQNEFPEILKLLITGAKCLRRNDDEEVNIIICKPEEAILQKFDLIILANVNNDNWPLTEAHDPWLNLQMRDALGLNSREVKLSLSLYYFYSLLHNDEVIITRSKKQHSGAESLPSNYLLKLQLILSKFHYLIRSQ